jgi:hypothetical protein
MCPSYIALDTNAVLDRHFMFWLSHHHTVKVLSPIAYAELAFGYFTRYGDLSRLDTMLGKSKIKIEKFSFAHARRTAEFVRRRVGEIRARPGSEEFKGLWNKAWRDCAIASPVSDPSWRLITFEINGFNFLGSLVKNPYDFKSQVEAGTEERGVEEE